MRGNCRTRSRNLIEGSSSAEGSSPTTATAAKKYWQLAENGIHFRSSAALALPAGLDIELAAMRPLPTLGSPQPVVVGTDPASGMPFYEGHETPSVSLGRTQAASTALNNALMMPADPAPMGMTVAEHNPMTGAPAYPEAETAIQTLNNPQASNIRLRRSMSQALRLLRTPTLMPPSVPPTIIGYDPASGMPVYAQPQMPIIPPAETQTAVTVPNNASGMLTAPASTEAVIVGHDPVSGTAVYSEVEVPTQHPASTQESRKSVV